MARREAVRSENDHRVEAVRAAGLPGAISFVCECENVHCAEAVWLTKREYEYVRGSASATLLARAHGD